LIIDPGSYVVIADTSRFYLGTLRLRFRDVLI
jgi:hypothetical protein